MLVALHSVRSEHAVSEYVLAGAAMNCTATVQDLMGEQTRLLVAVAFTEIYVVRKSHTLRGAQTRSLLAVGAWLWYSNFASQEITPLHVGVGVALKGSPYDE